MPEEMRGGIQPASSTVVRELSPDARDQLLRATEQAGMHLGRMAKRAGPELADDMWGNVLLGLHSRLVSRGPVEDLDKYLNRCVTNQLCKLRATVEVLVGDETLAVLRARQGDHLTGEVVRLNHELIETVRGIRALDLLTPRQMAVFVLGQILGEDNRMIAEWLDPPTTARAVATLKWRANREINKAWRDGRLAHLGFDPPR
ncbi:hypothetical protein ABZV77_06810 [Streptomyces sp. NPDC004732]|uniref:hypothetical protein n=1 Tax=Streptomyces sp. NPDC004732 TaxID=3154290 RepID=UPI0033AAD2F7